MLLQESRFCDLPIGELFDYRDQLYRKESEDFAELLRLSTGEAFEEYISHHFEPDVFVIPIESDGYPVVETLAHGSCNYA